jgi:hypothetical protein
MIPKAGKLDLFSLQINAGLQQIQAIMTIKNIGDFQIFFIIYIYLKCHNIHNFYIKTSKDYDIVEWP